MLTFDEVLPRSGNGLNRISGELDVGGRKFRDIQEVWSWNLADRRGKSLSAFSIVKFSARGAACLLKSLLLWQWPDNALNQYKFQGLHWFFHHAYRQFGLP